MLLLSALAGRVLVVRSVLFVDKLSLCVLVEVAVRHYSPDTLLLARIHVSPTFALLPTCRSQRGTHHLSRQFTRLHLELSLAAVYTVKNGHLVHIRR